MPLIHRIATDMFEFADVADYMVNPCNLLGVAGAGLSLEFRKRVPNFIDPYRLACKNKELRIGTVQVFEDTDQSWGMINFPTKRHYQDTSSKEDIVRGLEALRELLMGNQYRWSTIGMPMLGCGLGKQDYDTVYPLMVDYLSDLEACVFLSMAPDKTDMTPRYLTIAGPMDYGNTDEDRQMIDKVIAMVLQKWNVSLSDYTGIVSGGYHGVDAYVCGETFNKDYENTFVYRNTQHVPIVVKPNVHRHGVGSNLHLGNLLCEIGDDVILLKPKGHNNNRLSAMQVWLKTDEEIRARDGRYPRRVAIWGDKDNNPVREDVLIPETDIPY